MSQLSSALDTMIQMSLAAANQEKNSINIHLSNYTDSQLVAMSMSVTKLYHLSLDGHWFNASHSSAAKNGIAVSVNSTIAV